jgi:hypothetical protein
LAKFRRLGVCFCLWAYFYAFWRIFMPFGRILFWKVSPKRFGRMFFNKLPKIYLIKVQIFVLKFPVFCGGQNCYLARLHLGDIFFYKTSGHTGEIHLLNCICSSSDPNLITGQSLAKVSFCKKMLTRL